LLLSSRANIEGGVGFRNSFLGKGERRRGKELLAPESSPLVSIQSISCFLLQTLAVARPHPRIE
jgi:hypothetical protein